MDTEQRKAEIWNKFLKVAEKLKFPTDHYFLLPEKSVTFSNDKIHSIPEKYAIDVTIDIRFSEKKIKDGIISLIRERKKRNIDNDKMQMKLLDLPKKKPTKKRFRHSDDLDRYEQAIEVYSCRRDTSLSWGKIVRKFDFVQNVDHARNLYKSAEKYLQSGLPFLPFD